MNGTRGVGDGTVYIPLLYRTQNSEGVEMTVDSSPLIERSSDFYYTDGTLFLLLSLLVVCPIQMQTHRVLLGARRFKREGHNL